MGSIYLLENLGDFYLQNTLQNCSVGYSMLQL